MQVADKLLVMTDLHITGADQDIIGLDPLVRFQDALSQACAAHPDAKAVILMGDLTHHGTPGQYERLKSVLADLKLPVIPMLGNHDRRDAFIDVFADAPVDRAGFVQSIMDLPDHRVITLDTLDGPPYPKGHHSGRLCDARLAWLRGALDDAHDKMALVFAHHPPFETGIIGMDNIKLTNGAQFLDVLRTHPNVHLFCGHLHRTISGRSQGISWTVFKSTCHHGVLDLTNPDSTLSVDEPGAYGLVLASDNGVAAHSEDVISNRAIKQDETSRTA